MSGPGQRKSSPKARLGQRVAAVAGVLVFCGLIYVVVSMVLSDKAAPRKPPRSRSSRSCRRLHHLRRRLPSRRKWSSRLRFRRRSRRR